MNRLKTENHLSWFQKNRFANHAPCYNRKQGKQLPENNGNNFIGLVLEEK